MTVGSTECCGSTELGSGAFRAKRGRVGCGRFPDQGATRTELKAGGGGLCGCGMESEKVRGPGRRRPRRGRGQTQSSGSISWVFREGLCTGTGKAYVLARSP